MKTTVTLIALGLLLVGSIGFALSDSQPWNEPNLQVEDQDSEDDDSEDHESRQEHESSGWPKSRNDVAPAQDPTYQNECGGCHFAYQPGLLPATAWARIMDALGDHYGDDASVDEAEATTIRRYLVDHAADRSSLSRSRAFAALQRTGDALPRITDTTYFRREHHEIPPRLVQGNEAVGRFGNCQACHRNAAAGIYNEHQVVIPGVGRWDD